MFVEITRKRRSVKQYTDQPVEQDKIETIIETALRIPSGRAIRPWEYVVVTDRKLIEQLSVAKAHGADFIKAAPLAVVVCADPSKSHLWVEDCAIAAVTMQYAAVSLGLASRWAHIRGNQYNDSQSSRDYIADLLGLPDNLDIECVVAVGYPAEKAVPYKQEDLDFNKVSYNRYGQHG